MLSILNFAAAIPAEGAPFFAFFAKGRHAAADSVGLGTYDHRAHCERIKKAKAPRVTRGF